ncbi:alkaline phosphatase-like protein [Suhomyces tanzawaensis NRRL Y-17324]|uniref:Alkaline phosphatase-like protein n=1 Tax=Suhomyces tanzawaensis NRRL Y-17324 TaxID=984487 RepID=A0A1E4SDT5_9ASCO|nr:alkaline phosphatase-like protein [Suhomyces tanzawaensis NRRL Y-17324]ODV77680.1 alkaline phosphatase-like protein [Suhomyces tanzawaensis NRRL Y-17324]
MTGQKKPNFIVIVADDLGFTDLSAFGGEIDTPNLKRLGDHGYRFTDFHTASACSPTRSMLLSGTDNHIAGLGQMAEFSRGFPEQFGGKPGYEGYLNYRVAALPEIMHDSGYYTLLSGKWHLGLTKEYWPSARGFEKTFTLLPGAGNHYKYFPLDEVTGETASFMKPLFEENGETIDPFSLPEDYYSSDYFTDRFINYLKDDDRKERPFFGLLTFTAPHWPYQAPEEVIKKYKGVYDGGPQELRSKRLANALKLGIIPEGVVPHQVETQREKAWKDLSDEEKDIEARIMETYAAMVDVVDQNIGRLINHLETAGELDNTFILFMSDNGACGMLMEALPLKNENFRKNIEKNYDNRLENIGKKDSFVWYSDQWAQAASAPSYMYKMWASEGGIRCPLILHYPDLINNEKRGKVKREFTTVMDILPTILEIAGINHPGEVFQGRKVVKVRGHSWLGYLKEEQESVHSEDSVVGWELFAQQAVRKGKYKALFIPEPLGPEKWQLFDLSTDPGETRDLSEELSWKLDEMLNHWTQYVAETGLVECTGLFKYEYDKKILYD